jgi:hypothetical protein
LSNKKAACMRLYVTTTKIEHLIDFVSSGPLDFRPGDRVAISDAVRRGEIVSFTELFPGSYLLKKLTLKEAAHHPGRKYVVDRGAEPQRVAFHLMDSSCPGDLPGTPARVILKLVGYWYSEWEPHLPRPQPLQKPEWDGQEREKVVAYLKAGHHYFSDMGYSNCRFSCGIREKLMGSRTYYDGKWVWPEGLAHYVEAHSVCLPEAFLDTMRSNGWVIPDLSRIPPGRWDIWEMDRKLQAGGPRLCLDQEALPELEEDLSFWIDWAAQSAREP